MLTSVLCHATAGIVPDSGPCEFAHQASKSTNRSSCHRDPQLHYMRRHNTLSGLAFMAEGASWTAQRFDRRQGMHEDVEVSAGPRMLQLLRASKRLLTLVEGEPAAAMSSYRGKTWTIRFDTAAATAATHTLVDDRKLLAAYKAYFAADCRYWTSVRYTVASAYTHHSAPKQYTSGLGRYRGDVVHRTEPANAPACDSRQQHNIHMSKADDVMVDMRGCPGLVAATAPCRLLYFFTHKANVPIAGVETVAWVVLKRFTKHMLSGGVHKSDDVSGEYVYNLTRTAMIMPADRIIGHAHMYHHCYYSGGDSVACHLSTTGALVHVSRGPREEYLYNAHAYYPDEPAGLRR